LTPYSIGRILYSDSPEPHANGNLKLFNALCEFHLIRRKLLPAHQYDLLNIPIIDIDFIGPTTPMAFFSGQFYEQIKQNELA